MAVDPSRHLDVFSPAAFGSRRVDVIGCGATGSRVALSIAKLGIDNIHIWDFDLVEEHNIANQVFGLSHVGMTKVEALANIILDSTGTSVVIHNAKVDGTQQLGEIVFLLVDSMASRKEIFDNGLKYKLRTKLMIETRMGSDSGKVYAINPNNPNHIKAWGAMWFPDDDEGVEVS